MTVARLHILVVDDVADVADSTADVLGLWGYDAVACYSGAAALEAATRCRPAAIVLDLAMPRMDGFRFAGLLRLVPGCRAVPLIAVTGYSGPEYCWRARAAGIDHYLLKPADLDELKALLAEATKATEAEPVIPPVREDPAGHRDILKFRRPRRPAAAPSPPNRGGRAGDRLPENRVDGLSAWNNRPACPCGCRLDPANWFRVLNTRCWTWVLR